MNGMTAVAIRVGVCDDDPLVLSALASYIEAAPDLVVSGLFRTGAELLAALDEADIDVVLLDVRMPGMSGPEVALEMSRRHAGACVIYLTSFATETPSEDALSGRVRGALTKDISPADLAQAIRVAHAGITLLGAAFLGPAPSRLVARIEELSTTDRETAILRLVSGGASNGEIARRLNVSESTVKQALQVLSRRAGVTNRTALLMDLHGITGPDSPQGD